MAVANVPTGKQRTWPKCVGAGVTALAICIAMQLSLRAIIGWSLLAFYLPSYLDGAEHTGERFWPWYADASRSFMSNIPTTMVLEEAIDPTKQYIFCSHPHGVLSAHHGVLITGSAKPSFHDISPMHTRNDLAASIVFRIPLYREILIWLGCTDASRATAQKLLTKGKSLVILVGGIAEQMLCMRGEHTIYAKKRKGHVRLALKYGVPIVPAYAFGETDLYTHSTFLLKFRQWFAKNFSTALLVSWGAKWWNPIVPHEGVVMNQVFGKPIAVQKIENPTPEDIDKVHQQYIDELVRIFNKYKKQYGYADKELKVV